MFSEASYIDKIGRLKPNSPITNIPELYGTEQKENDDHLGKRKSIRKK